MLGRLDAQGIGPCELHVRCPYTKLSSSESVFGSSGPIERWWTRGLFGGLGGNDDLGPPISHRAKTGILVPLRHPNGPPE